MLSRGVKLWRNDKGYIWSEIRKEMSAKEITRTFDEVDALSTSFQGPPTRVD
jgi:hypothetical protein